MKGVQPSTLWKHSPVGRPAAPGQGVPGAGSNPAWPSALRSPGLGLRVGATEGERRLRG